MNLDRVEIQNFRSIENATLKFDPRCRILVGKNEAGKSNILAACALLDPDRQVESTDLRETRDDEEPVEKGRVLFVFRLSATEIAKLKGAWARRVIGEQMVLCTRLSKPLTATEFAGEFFEWLWRVELPSGARSSSYWTKSGYKLEPGWVISRRNVDLTIFLGQFGSSKGVATVGERVLAHSSKVGAGFASMFEPATFELIGHEIFSISDAIATPQLPPCMYWRYSDENLLPPSISVDSFRNNPDSCRPLRAMFLLAGETDIARSIDRAREKPHGLRNLLTRIARLTTAHVRSRWKELAAVEIVLSPNGNQVDAAVKDEFNEFAFHRRSDGFKRFVSFLIMVSVRSKANDLSQVLFIQDEPDLGLHPSGSKSLLAELIQLSKSNYVLVSTHSIFLIDKERVERHCIVEKAEESTKLVAVDRSQIQDEEVLYNALGYSVLDLVRERNIVFEGWRDKRLFQIQIGRRGLAEKFIRDQAKHTVGIVHAMGIKDIPKVVTLFEAMQRKALVVSDSDQVAIEKQAIFVAANPETPWLRYDELMNTRAVLTGEDFIVPQRLRSALVEVFGRLGINSDVPPDLFPAEQRESAVELAKAFIATLAVPVDSKEILMAWKSQIFDGLQPEQIRAEYSSVVEAIAKRLGYVADEASGDGD